MPLAHTASSGGPNTEILLLGAGMLVLSLVFFFQKSVSRQASLVLLVLGAAAITGAFTLGGGSSDASLAIEAPADGATVDAGRPLALELDMHGVTLAAEDPNDGGHLHVYVDGETVAMPPTLDVEIELEPGEHDVEVEWVDAEHAAPDPPVTDSVTVTAE